MTLVLDASAVVEFILGTVKGSEVRALIESDNAELHAPDLILAEGLSALRSLERRAEITPDRATSAAADLRSVPLVRYPTTILARRIWTLRGRFTVYDAHYIALAETLRAPMVTGDRKLATAAADLIRIKII
jgi:predicted nucleic acid-binding protein